MADKNLAPVCGLCCGTCEYLEKKQCKGCGNVKGRPFWTAQMKIEVCPFYDCCINKKQLEHCGLCDELPCETFKLYDPSLSPEEGKKQIADRQNEVLRRKELGTEKWLQEKEVKEDG
ncbi:DUF3795 domain-containing protein [bacterium]|nr:DUF3795 domain-containing protein [bacterium]MBU1614432.1 DUF3795 domain-containing protein [bacterium]